MVQFGSPHFLLEFLVPDDRTEEFVGVQKDAVIEKNVVDPDDPLFSEESVVQKRTPLMERFADGEMGVVIQVCPCADNPVDKPRFL